LNVAGRASCKAPAIENASTRWYAKLPGLVVRIVNTGSKNEAMPSAPFGRIISPRYIMKPVELICLLILHDLFILGAS
jgi:hypothetical protein